MSNILRVRSAAAALVIAALPLARAEAGVEYVTTTANCTSKVADITTGATLEVIAGPSITFEVWGNSVDLTDATDGLTFSGPSGMTAQIVTRHSGPSNLGRGCGNVGSAVVRISTSGTLGADASASLSFRMPLGDKSRLPMTIKAHPTFTAVWTTNGALQPSALPCIVKTGSITPLNQDARLEIQLPPGHRQDATTCTSNVLNVRTVPASIGHVDVVGPTMKYDVTGLPSFVTVNQATAVLPQVGTQLTFTFDVAGIRALTAARTSTITITDPVATNRTETLTLVVRPDLGQGFASAATANPSSTAAGNPIDFTLRLSSPAGSGQVITWRMTTASCFTEAIAQAPYRATAPFQFFRFPEGQTSAIIRVRSVNGAGCTNKLSPVTHIFEAWIGDARTDPQVTAVSSGPSYTRANVALLFQ
jgi:hypothetical protein